MNASSPRPSPPSCVGKRGSNVGVPLRLRAHSAHYGLENSLHLQGKGSVRICPTSPPNLLLEHFAVEIAALKEFLVTTAFRETAFLQHQNLVSVLHRGKSL